uniref:AIG1-type G domain-containing protein n=1 Tax=Acanthochromis polyacanthus TaxID=80966 RepID=A0A3Q1GLJ0_9TELE
MSIDIISKSRLLHPGSPSIYQLEPKKETFGTLTKLTVGERNVNKINKTILLVGETGTGKSTLINALVNHTMGVKWEDEVWFKIIEEEKKSQTETDGVHEVNAVGLMMKASENRVSDRLLYIFDSMMSLFGNNIEENIVALITHSDGTYPENVLQALKYAKIKCTRDEDNDPVYFLFNNCLDKQRTKKDKFGLETAWKVTERGMSEFMTFLEETGPQKLNKTVEVLNKRVRLTACIQNLEERIKSIEGKQKEIRQVEEVLKKYEEEMKKNKNFTVEVDEIYKVKEDIEGGMWGLGFYQGAVTCKVCEENCHYAGCAVAWYPRDCEVMKGGRCTSCTRKCRVEDHVKEEWIYVTKTRRVKKTLEDMKQKYEKNQAEGQKKSSLLEDLRTEMIQLEAEKNQVLEEAYQHVVNLEKIALKAHSGSTSIQLDFLIEKMKEKGDTEKVHMLEEMKRKQEEGNKGAVQYMWSGMKTAGEVLKGWMK